MKSMSLIVTVATEGSSRSRVWDTRKPLQLGAPLSCVLERTVSGIQVRDHGKATAVHMPASGKGATVRLRPGLSLALRPMVAFDPAGLTTRTEDALFDDKARLSEQEERAMADFRRSLMGSAAGMALLFLILIGLSLLKPKEEELVPEQFAKIVMAPAPKPKAKAEPAGSSSRGGGKAINKKSSVVQAFKGASLQAAASKLLKGGMTRLLAQSDFVMGNAASAKARQSFAAKSVAMAATATAVGLTNGRKVEVAGIGGSGSGKGGVGYGRGEKAGVAGQGQGFVKLDAPGATVDEGLTRDEVGAVIHKHMSEIRYCYESSILRYPSIEGKLVVAFVIGGQGTVKTAEVKDSTLPDPKLDDCIVRRLRSWQFPLPRGGVDVAVSYPFIFKSLGG